MILMATFKSVKSTTTNNLLCLLLLVFGPLPVFAASGSHPFPLESDWGPFTYSVGGASAAVASNTDAITTNPAGLSLLQGSGLAGGQYLRMPLGQNRWGISVVDGSNDIVGGFRFYWDESNGGVKKKFTTALAYRLPFAVIGVSGHVVHFSDMASGNGWHFTHSVGFLSPLGAGFSIGAFINSLYDLEKDLHIPPSAHFGALYTYPQFFRIAFDADRRLYIDNQDWNYSIGGDFLVNEFFAVRSGYRWAHDINHSFWTAGAAMLAPKLHVSGFFMRTVDEHPENGFGFDVYLKM